MSLLGSPISADLNLNPLGAGNPYAGILSGPVGLAQQYGASYNNALAANQKNYDSIINGYQTVMNNVGSILGQGGGWGVAAPAAQAIADVYAQQSGGAFQNSINKGLGNTTAASAAQRGAALDANKAYAGLGSQLAQTAAGYSANLGQGQLNFMNSVNIPYPNGADYSTLYQQYGAAQANAQNNALLAAAQKQSYYAANQAAAGRGGGAGGVSVGAAPRGGTYGSGGGGFASGGAGSSPYMYGAASNPNAGGPGASGYGNPVQNTFSTVPYSTYGVGGGVTGGVGAGILGSSIGDVLGAGIGSVNTGYGVSADEMSGPSIVQTAANAQQQGAQAQVAGGKSPVTKPGDWGLSGFNWS